MSSSNGRILSRQIKALTTTSAKELPPTIVEAARSFLSRTESVRRWRGNEKAFNRTVTHRTMALKFLDRVDTPDTDQ